MDLLNNRVKNIKIWLTDEETDLESPSPVNDNTGAKIPI